MSHTDPGIVGLSTVIPNTGIRSSSIGSANLERSSVFGKTSIERLNDETEEKNRIQDRRTKTYRLNKSLDNTYDIHGFEALIA